MTDPKSRAQLPSEELEEAQSLLIAATNQRDEARANLTHEGSTAAEWASRYASLAEAAYPVLAWLPRNDPGARMVAERLEGVLAGQAYEPEAARHYAETTEANCTVRLPYSDPLCAFREVTRWRDMQARTYEDGCKLLERFQAQEVAHSEAQAELTRLKEENARLQKALRSAPCQVNDCQEEACWFYCEEHESGRILELKRELAHEKAAHEVTRRELHHLQEYTTEWETGERRRLCAVVEAARAIANPESGPMLYQLRAVREALSALDRPEGEQAEAPKVCGTVSRSGRMSCTEPPLHDGPCSDKGDAFAVATPPESPVPAEAPREIRVGSKWSRPTTVLEVVRVNEIDERLVHYSIEGGHCGMDDREMFDVNYTHVSDPEPPAERPVVGEGEL